MSAEACERMRTAVWLGREDSNLRMAESKSAALPLGYAPPGPLEVAHGDSLLHSTWPLRPVSTRGRETKRYERRDHTCAVGDDQRLIRGFIRTAHQRSEVDGLPAHRPRVQAKARLAELAPLACNPV